MDKNTQGIAAQGDTTFQIALNHFRAIRFGAYPVFKIFPPLRADTRRRHIIYAMGPPALPVQHEITILNGHESGRLPGFPAMEFMFRLVQHCIPAIKTGLNLISPIGPLFRFPGLFERNGRSPGKGQFRPGYRLDQSPVGRVHLNLHRQPVRCSRPQIGHRRAQAQRLTFKAGIKFRASVHKEHRVFHARQDPFYSGCALFRGVPPGIVNSKRRPYPAFKVAVSMDEHGSGIPAQIAIRRADFEQGHPAPVPALPVAPRLGARMHRQHRRRERIGSFRRHLLPG
ncbi:MAG: hypothetical protein BWY09_02512 [Candidatus Hydrogenedentes bacterium ADurb.Bin179]|nr:MAG: hypothetical protein BWY09_02512 [Candidatus Hydrogenedentes bacterium ADurb.Bin179]